MNQSLPLKLGHVQLYTFIVCIKVTVLRLISDNIVYP